MSRIGKLPVAIPEGVEVKVDGNNISVKGAKGELNYEFPAVVNVKVEDNNVVVTVESEEYSNFWGLVRALVANMVAGVSTGFEKKLLVLGVGYTAKVQGSTLVLGLGYSHPINYELPKGISAAMEKDPKGNDVIAITGIDKQLVGQTAAKVRSFRSPEPYKGKGIRYLGEVVKLKAGKTAKK